MNEVTTFRLYLMRALYLLMFVGQGILQWPVLAHHTNALSFWHGVGSSMLGAMALLAGLGIRYPLQMLPLLLFELAWKAIWLIAIAFPLWYGQKMDPDTLANAPSILMGAILLFIIPWPYVYSNFVKNPGNKWK